MKKALMLVSAFALLAGVPALAAGSAQAAAPAPVYKAAGPQGGAGWSTASLPNGRYAVTYTGDSKMKKDQVAKFAFLRAAEFTQESGFEWFAVIASQVRDVEVGSAEDVAGRTGSFMGGTGAVGTGSGGGNGMGGGGGSVNTGPSTGGFGGGDAPPAVMEHWQPKKVPQAVLIIQMGKGDQANFEGLTKQPEIFDAKSTIAELRAPAAN